MNLDRVPWRLLVPPLLGALIGFAASMIAQSIDARRWFTQQESGVTQEAYLLSRTLSGSSDTNAWLGFVRGLQTMNWGSVEIVPDGSLSEVGRRSFVINSAEWIAEPGNYYRISIRQPIKRPEESAPSDWLIYTRRIQKPSASIDYRPWIFSLAGVAAGGAVAWWLMRCSKQRQACTDTLRAIKSRVKHPLARTELLSLFPKSLTEDPISRELIGICDQLHQSAFTNYSGAETSEAILSAMPEGLLAFSSKLELTFVNRAAIQLLNLGSRIRDNIPLIDLIRHPRILTLVQDVQSRSMPLDCELEIRDDDLEEVTLHIRAYGIPKEPFLDEGSEESAIYRHAILLVVSDTTRLKQLENYRRDFTANVSHELKTPLAAIKGYSETLLMGALDDPDVRLRFVTSIGEQANKLDQLVRGLMQINRIQSTKEKLALVPLRLDQIIRGVIAGQQSIADANQITIESAYQQMQNLYVLAELDSIRTVLGNLLSNAVRYSKKGGCVRIEAQAQEKIVEVLVIDQGIGIPAGDLERIFERFYTVDKARSRDLGGTGLGLAIVKHLMIAMGGTVRAESELGVGSTFRITLERSEPPTPSSSEI